MAAPDDCYHAGMRILQDQFDTHRLADQLTEHPSRLTARTRAATQHAGS